MIRGTVLGKGKLVVLLIGSDMIEQNHVGLGLWKTGLSTFSGAKNKQRKFMKKYKNPCKTDLCRQRAQRPRAPHWRSDPHPPPPAGACPWLNPGVNVVQREFYFGC